MGRPIVAALAARPLFFEPVPPSARAASARGDAQFAATASLVAGVGRVDAVNVPELVDENHDGRPYLPVGERADGSRGSSRTPRPRSRSSTRSWPTSRAPGHSELGRGDDRARRPVVRPRRRVEPVHPVSRPGRGGGGPALPARRRAGRGACSATSPSRNAPGRRHRMLAKTAPARSSSRPRSRSTRPRRARLVQEYDLLCRQAGLAPAAVVVSVAPLADEADASSSDGWAPTLPEPTERAILNGDESGAARRSVAHALALWTDVRRALAEEADAEVLGRRQRRAALATPPRVGRRKCSSAFARAIDADVYVRGPERPTGAGPGRRRRSSGMA